MIISGFILRAHRLDKGVSCKSCADYLDITTTYLSLIETGKNKPSKKVLKKAAVLFDLDEGYFLSLPDSLLPALDAAKTLTNVEKNILSSLLASKM
ncbi:helix-turn-helix domain-containing protein [Photobacterium swingsii]|uniref:XRE family transcriptional regulator n=1 Tax=Photobacterium swingsii TaxID=680026 RepID=A0A0J8Y2V6_9GAMM|nr:helix-turn-helix transcriptional regulator [Photobacterium swingsii]KMV31904.1 hypothetical protein AB733_03960 [Photobacterium swingsii]PSW25551.1 XRE family transcriptional regulator [Photobacterium swingsii]